jgi:hypothetical protein
MVNVSQDPMTRRWGFRITEGDMGLEAPNMGTQRIICEDFTQESPQDVFAYVNAIKKALEINFVRIEREGIVYGYKIYDPSTRQIIFSEGGWMGQGAVQEHLDNIKKNIQGDIKMVIPPKPIKMALGATNPQGSNEVRSVYTDPVTGKVYDSGTKGVAEINLDEVRRQAEADAKAEAKDDTEWLGRV